MMFDYSKCMNRMIFCIDLYSFFASCACVMRGLDPLKVKLAIVGDVNRNGSIVSAATPELKKLDISTATRLYEILKDSNIIIVNAAMVTPNNAISLVDPCIQEFHNNTPLFPYYFPFFISYYS